MNEEEKKLRRKIGKMTRADRAYSRGQAEITARSFASSKKPGRGSGTHASDLWSPGRQEDAYFPEDERRGVTFCALCGKVVRHVDVDGTWSVRNENDDLPHVLSCDGD